MVFAYIVHGPTRLIVHGLRLYCFAVGWLLAGALFVYGDRLRRYTRPVEWSGSFKTYRRAWLNHNKRLVGRMLLTATLIFFDLTAIGTEIRRWNHDVGYWRLPANMVGVTLGLGAVILLLAWNTLTQEQSVDVVAPPPVRPGSRKQPQSSPLIPWLMCTTVVLAFIAYRAYVDHPTDQGTRCVVAALALTHPSGTALPAATAADVQQACGQFTP